MRKQKITANIKNPYNFEPIKKVYVSEDGIVWNEDKTLSEVPIGNGKNKTLILGGELPDGNTRYTKKDCQHCRVWECY